MISLFGMNIFKDIPCKGEFPKKSCETMDEWNEEDRSSSSDTREL